MKKALFPWGKRTYIMGILNSTPDSFSDGGSYQTLEPALEQADKMLNAGADMIDIGGQSTRPGAAIISLEEELARTIPLISALSPHCSVPISIDTTRAVVAEAAIAVGADWVNDVSAGTDDPAMLATVARLEVPIILMHRRGTPQTMQSLTEYVDLIGEIKTFLQSRIDQALAKGISPEQIILDPGIGFAKTTAQNLEVLRQLPQLQALGFPLLVGPSRKRFIGDILQEPNPQKRVWGTAAACCAAIAAGSDILRVHDVAEMVQVCRVADALWRNHS